MRKFLYAALTSLMISVLFCLAASAGSVISYEFPNDTDEDSGVTDGFTIKNGFHNCIYNGSLSTICTLGNPITFITPALEEVKADYLYFSLRSKYADESSVITLTINTADGECVADEYKLTGTGFNVYSKQISKLTSAIVSVEITVNAFSGQDEMYAIDLDYLRFVTAEQMISMKIGSKNVFSSGEFFALEAPPVIANNRTLMPARFVAESLGAKVVWNEKERSVAIAYEDTVIRLVIDSATSYVGSEAFELDCAPCIINDFTYTPARFIAEKLGADVEWDEKSQTVLIFR